MFRAVVLIVCIGKYSLCLALRGEAVMEGLK